ncbi:hypothetical protein [Neobacillus muris]|uniref:hypothetical protein n=1 Tax=Neobacillus muris TaxID=2941334 RepID=UPI00203B6710|nr:hypothetical protein [Neobacillus muris]
MANQIDTNKLKQAEAVTSIVGVASGNCVYLYLGVKSPLFHKPFTLKTCKQRIRLDNDPRSIKSSNSTIVSYLEGS